MRFSAAQSPQALVSRVAYEGFEAEADSVGIGSRATGRLCFLEESVIEIEGFLHTYNSAIQVWPFGRGFF